MAKAELSKEMFEFLVNSHVVASVEGARRQIKNDMEKATTIQDLKIVLEKAVVSINAEIKVAEYQLELARTL